MYIRAEMPVSNLNMYVSPSFKRTYENNLFTSYYITYLLCTYINWCACRQTSEINQIVYRLLHYLALYVHTYMYVPKDRPNRDKWNNSYIFTSMHTYNNVHTYRQTLFHIIKNVYLLLYSITIIRTYDNVHTYRSIFAVVLM